MATQAIEILEGIVELDPKDDADFIAKIEAFKVAKDAYDAAKLVKDALRDELDEEFANVGIMGKGEVRLNGKTLLKRAIGRRFTFDRAILFRLAPKAAKRAEKAGEPYPIYTRPKG